jgi:hypothetical protein
VSAPQSDFFLCASDAERLTGKKRYGTQEGRKALQELWPDIVTPPALALFVLVAAGVDLGWWPVERRTSPAGSRAVNGPGRAGRRDLPGETAALEVRETPLRGPVIFAVAMFELHGFDIAVSGAGYAVAKFQIQPCRRCGRISRFRARVTATYIAEAVCAREVCFVVEAHSPTSGATMTAPNSRLRTSSMRPNA